MNFLTVVYEQNIPGNNPNFSCSLAYWFFSHQSWLLSIPWKKTIAKKCIWYLPQPKEPVHPDLFNIRIDVHKCLTGISRKVVSIRASAILIRSKTNLESSKSQRGEISLPEDERLDWGNKSIELFCAARVLYKKNYHNKFLINLQIMFILIKTSANCWSFFFSELWLKSKIR